MYNKCDKVREGAYVEKFQEMSEVSNTSPNMLSIIIAGT